MFKCEDPPKRFAVAAAPLCIPTSNARGADALETVTVTSNCPYILGRTPAWSCACLLDLIGLQCFSWPLFAVDLPSGGSSIEKWGIEVSDYY